MQHGAAAAAAAAAAAVSDSINHSFVPPELRGGESVSLLYYPSECGAVVVVAVGRIRPTGSSII